eukprot:TRINITY_DN37033_c0_g1_i1.p1 TRINITY_DN37033_c0_g1~~TRINITY_DN37033_c0_g1_i1.p1  ORF type:complete len:491 (-),score=96.42 TRINITY_DN37033_c0_g1_i1:102-1574(-)
MAGRKVFVGSLPDGIQESAVRDAFAQFGELEEVFVKQGCETGRQFAFVTFATADQANFAKESTDRKFVFPGADRPVEVMVARNQGLHGQPSAAAPAGGGGGGGQRKLLVGSLPDGVSEQDLQDAFSQYGALAEVFVKPGCESGRQWAFVTFVDADAAFRAKEACDRMLTLPGATRPCEVMMAKNQGSHGSSGGDMGAMPSMPAMPAPPDTGPRKVLVGSLPDGVSDAVVREAFSSYGTIVDCYVKQNCDPGRQWAFVTFSSSQEAQLAKASADRVLMVQGATRPCEVMFPKGSGGQDSSALAAPMAAMPSSQGSGQCKIHVGSLPGDVSEQQLRAEFGRYGQIVDCYVKSGCERGRQWAFVTFARSDQANAAKDACDRILIFPGGERACEVMIARNQGRGGDAAPAGAAGAYPHMPMGQPPPPSYPVPAYLGWRCYTDPRGFPYYHNHATGVTQWECPPELGGMMMNPKMMMPAMPAMPAMPPMPGYRPY